MNNKVLAIDDISTEYGITFDCQRLTYEDQSRDEDIHDWLMLNSKLFDKVERILIPLRLGKSDAAYIGLHIGLHIRLMKDFGETRFAPIVFISESTKEEIIQSQLNNYSEKTALFLFTKAVYLMSSFDVQDKFLARQIAPTEDYIFKDDLRTKVVFKSPEKGHDLANEWGAFRLAKCAGIALKSAKPKSLFFKYKDYLSNNVIVPDGKQKKILNNNACNALLIDDHADSGWRECLDFILKNNLVNVAQAKRNLDCIKNFDEADAIKDYSIYDIVFLDLRLAASEDKADQIIDIQDFTGAKILKKIKEQNKGIHVIIFTASNKAWNIQQLLEMGANGYYIKESPEYVLSDKFSTDNYNGLLKTIINGIESNYLKNVWLAHKRSLDFLEQNKINVGVDYRDFYNRSKASLEVAFELLGRARINHKYFNLAFLTYYQILEDFTSQIENFEYKSETECYVKRNNGPLRVIDNSTGQVIWLLTFSQNNQGGFFTINNSIALSGSYKVQSLSKISFLLVFKFGKSNTDLLRWGRLNNVRNTKAGHIGKNFVSISEILEILEFVELFLMCK